MSMSSFASDEVRKAAQSRGYIIPQVSLFGNNTLVFMSLSYLLVDIEFQVLIYFKACTVLRQSSLFSPFFFLEL